MFYRNEKNETRKSPDTRQQYAQLFPWYDTATAMRRGISCRVGAFG
jgi:hypothetical protein